MNISSMWINVIYYKIVYCKYYKAIYVYELNVSDENCTVKDTRLYLTLSAKWKKKTAKDKFCSVV